MERTGAPSRGAALSLAVLACSLLIGMAAGDDPYLALYEIKKKSELKKLSQWFPPSEFVGCEERPKRNSLVLSLTRPNLNTFCFQTDADTSTCARAPGLKPWPCCSNGYRNQVTNFNLLANTFCGSSVVQVAVDGRNWNFNFNATTGILSVPNISKRRGPNPFSPAFHEICINLNPLAQCSQVQQFCSQVGVKEQTCGVVVHNKDNSCCPGFAEGYTNVPFNVTFDFLFTGKFTGSGLTCRTINRQPAVRGDFETIIINAIADNTSLPAAQISIGGYTCDRRNRYRAVVALSQPSQLQVYDLLQSGAAILAPAVAPFGFNVWKFRFFIPSPPPTGGSVPPPPAPVPPVTINMTSTFTSATPINCATLLGTPALFTAYLDGVRNGFAAALGIPVDQVQLDTIVCGGVPFTLSSVTAGRHRSRALGEGFDFPTDLRMRVSGMGNGGSEMRQIGSGSRRSAAETDDFSVIFLSLVELLGLEGVDPEDVLGTLSSPDGLAAITAALEQSYSSAGVVLIIIVDDLNVIFSPPPPPNPPGILTSPSPPPRPPRPPPAYGSPPPVYGRRRAAMEDLLFHNKEVDENEEARLRSARLARISAADSTQTLSSQGDAAADTVVSSTTSAAPAGALVPAALSARAGDASTTIPLRRGSFCRYLVQVPESELAAAGLTAGARISGLSFRLAAGQLLDQPSPSAITFRSYEVFLGAAAGPASSLRPVFTQNYASGARAMARKGPLTLRPGALPSGSSLSEPGRFAAEATLPLDTPYTYAGGDLVVELVHSGTSTTAAPLLVLDARGYAGVGARAISTCDETAADEALMMEEDVATILFATQQ